MNQSFGQYLVRIDDEVTRSFYTAHNELCATDQAHRNYAQWMSSRSEEVTSYFSSIGIDDHRQCNILECYQMEDGLIHTMSLYCVAGAIIQEPDANDLIGSLFASKTVDGIGLFIMHEDSIAESRNPVNRFPSGQLLLCAMEDIPWLLDEPCELLIRDQFFAERHKQWKAEMSRRIFKLMDETGQPYKIMNPPEADALKKRCIERYVKPDDFEQTDEICWSSEESRGFLWHIFSWELCDCVVGDDARAKYEHLRTPSYYAFFEEDDYCFHVNGGQLPDLSAIEDVQDTYIISESLSWIYAHTHEDGWIGPFYSSIE